MTITSWFTMRSRPPGELTSIVFRALYREFDLISIDTIHIVTPVFGVFEFNGVGTRGV